MVEPGLISLAKPGFRRAILLVRGFALLAAITALCFWLGLSATAVASVYMVTVLLQPLDSSFVDTAALSAIAVLCLDFFFMDPVFSLRLTHPSDFVILGSFLAASLLATHIQAKRRREAAARRLEWESNDALRRAGQSTILRLHGPAVLEPLRSMFGIKAISLFDADTLEAEQLGVSACELTAKVRECYIQGKDADLPRRLRGCALPPVWRSCIGRRWLRGASQSRTDCDSPDFVDGHIL